MTSLQHIIILGAHNILMLMDQIFDKDDQAAKYCSFQTRHTSGGFRGYYSPPHSMYVTSRNIQKTQYIDI